MSNYERFMKLHELNMEIAREVTNEALNNIYSNDSSSNDEEFEKMNNDLNSLLED